MRDMKENKKRWIQAEINSRRGKAVIKAYVIMLLNGKIDLYKLAMIYRPNQKTPILTLRRYIKLKETQKMIDIELEKILTNEGVTKEFIIKKRKAILDKALEGDKPDLTNANRVLDSLEDMLDLKPTKNNGNFNPAALPDTRFVTLSENINKAIKEKEETLRLNQ